MREELSVLIKAEYPIIYVVTHEEDRAEQEVHRLVEHEASKRRVFSWTVTSGFVEVSEEDRSSPNHSTVSPEAAIEWVVRHREEGVYIFKDLHPFLDAPAVTRWLRDAIATFKVQQQRKTIILVSPVQRVPQELGTEVVVLDFALPSMTELTGVLEKQVAHQTTHRLSPTAKEKLVKAALGLTLDEAQKVYRKANVMRGRLTEKELDVVLSEKKQLIRRNGILDYMEELTTLDAVGGLDELKRWLCQRSNAFSESAREYGLPQPKGMLILGVPGCGKSLIAKTTSQLWGLPLLRLDMGRVYDGSMVGRSEANLRNALKTAESISPAILFIDELDKAFAGGAGSADSDGGTSSRIFGSFLTWMQEKTSPVFVMATANRIERLPGEFLRKGRFDEIFFVDLPTIDERSEIFKIHIQQRHREVDRFDTEQLAKVSEGFSGAEIEQALISAMYEAFAQSREFSQLDIIAAIKSTLPLSRTMSEQVAALRDWARQRARPAAAASAEYMQMEF
ncbi:MAG: AAA family ATPase [Prochlorotrichaceae cyanobacterium]|jgi:ATP-dependent 26S proteasome regulatory subunit